MAALARAHLPPPSRSGNHRWRTLAAFALWWAIGSAAGCTTLEEGAAGPAHGTPETAGGCALSRGTSHRTIDVDGARRRYTLRVGPDVARSGPSPLVFLWHGFGGNAREISSALRPNRDYPEAIVVTPQGLPRRFERFGRIERDGWQVEDGELGDRDLRFFDAMLDELIGTACVDETRVFSTGFSNGGFFSNLLGCERGDRVAAIAPVAGGIAPIAGGRPLARDCRGQVAVHVVHGTEDRTVPYRLGVISFERWTATNRCPASESPPPSGCLEASGCRQPVQMCSYRARHAWPRDGTARIVDFFRSIGGRARPL